MHPASTPISEVISGVADPEYVNRKFIASGFCDLKLSTVISGQGRIVSQTSFFPSPQSSEVFKFDEEDGPDAPASMTAEDEERSAYTTSLASATGQVDREILNRVSPDSEILCVSRDCPIKDFKHNEGRYFHLGLPVTKVGNPTGLTSTDGSWTEPVQYFFNFTNPPPDILAAYSRICDCKASQFDMDSVRQYQKHHMWAPTPPDAVMPIPRWQNAEPQVIEVVHAHILPLERRKIMLCSDDDNLDDNAVTDIMEIENNKVSGVYEGGHVRELCAADFDESDSDEEDWAGMSSDLHGLPFELSSIRNWNPFQHYSRCDEDHSTLPSVRREVPQGSELVTVQYSLQNRILDLIAGKSLQMEQDVQRDSVDTDSTLGFRSLWLE